MYCASWKSNTGTRAILDPNVVLRIIRSPAYGGVIVTSYDMGIVKNLDNVRISR
jgi:hypothetical protein